MAESTDPAAIVAANLAENVKTVTVDGLTVVTHSLPDQIAAAKFQAEREAVRQSVLPIRFAKVISDGLQ